MAFESTGPSGVSFTMDAIPEVGGKDLGPTPVEALVGSVAACSGIDVMSILEKKKQKVESYRIEVEYHREPPGSEWPRPVKSMVVRHIIRGENLDPAAVERSVQLSDEKYCTVIASLRIPVEVRSEWKVEG